MKVAIITILDNVNFGTYLQALATSIAIKNVGHDPIVIHYTRKIMTPDAMSKRLLKERGLLVWLYNKLRATHKKMYKLRCEDYKFLERYVNVTKEYIGFESLVADSPKADVYLTGSDQVWNSVYNRGIDKSYYLDFASKQFKRVAYAASIGMDAFPENEKVETENLLKQYSTITVREKQAAELLKKTFDIDAKPVIDPTLLLDKETWGKMAEYNDFTATEPYLLVYCVESKRQEALLRKYANLIAKEKGLKKYYVSPVRASRRGYDRCFGYASPNLFLKLVKNASFMLVSSFHGTAFSINFNKQFLSISARRFNSRVESLLHLTQLEDRMVSDANFDVHSLSDIDYDKVNEILQTAREEGIAQLKEMIS